MESWKANTASLESLPPVTGGPTALAMMKRQFKCSMFQTSFPNLNAFLKSSCLVFHFSWSWRRRDGMGALHCPSCTGHGRQ